MGTASKFSAEASAGIKARAEAVHKGGMAAVLSPSLDRWFTPETRSRRPDLIDRVTKTILNDDPAVHAAIWEIISEFNVHARLGEIRCPTLVLVGELDPSTPPSAALALMEAIPGARMVVFPNASPHDPAGSARGGQRGAEAFSSVRAKTVDAYATTAVSSRLRRSS